MDPKQGGKGHRRRGAELESALLDAAWVELTETGYTALTFEGIAQRAGTSRTVLYRRWETKADLVLAAVAHMITKGPAELPDTGSLRGDLVALMRNSNERSISSNALLFSYLGGYFRETGTSPKDLRAALIGDRTDAFDDLYARAAARGEVDLALLTPRLRTLPIDLFRHEAMMTLEPVPDAVIDEILDQIFLPLVTPKEPATQRRAG
jgi:AcrR family transcriptional regulator